MVRLRQHRLHPAISGLALACLAMRPVCAEPVHSLRLPGPVSELAVVAEVGGNRPAARIVDDVVRAIHPLAPGISAVVDAKRARVTSWLASEPSSAAAEARTFPSPLPGDCWRAALSLAGASDEQTTVRLLTSREFSLVYYGLMRATPGLRAYLATRPELVAALAASQPGVLAAFPRAVDIVDERVRLPGDAGLVPFWEALVGAPTADLPAFLLAALGKADGRIAFMLDTLARLDDARRAFALSGSVASPEARLDDLAMLADVFVSTHREWRPAERPFWRVRMDPLVVLAGLEVGADGRLAGTDAREFWTRVLDGPRPHARPLSSVDDREAATAGWLVRRVISGGDAASQLRLGAVAFTQRLLQRQPGQSPEKVAAAGRAFADVPALTLVLERMAVADPQRFVAAAAVARTLAEEATTLEGETALTTFQASIAILDRAVARRSIAADVAAVLLDEMCRIPGLSEPGGRQALASWVGTRLVPALAGGGDPARDVEAVVVDALAGVGSVHPDAPFAPFELDGEPHRLDLARPERDRLDLVRRRQRSVRLPAALALVRGADALRAAGTADEFDRLSGPLIERLGDAMSPRGAKASTGADEWPLRQARQSLQASKVMAPGARASFQRRVLSDVTAAAGWAVADALRGVAYAASLGDAEGVVTLAPDVSRRHRFGTGRVPGQALAAWSLPDEARDDGQVWFVRGALLGLEHALSALALRPVNPTTDAPARFIYEIARRQLALGVALANPLDATNQQRDEIADAVRRGSAETSALCGEAAQPISEAIDEGTGLQVAWACVNEPGSVVRLLTPDWLVDVGLGGRGDARLDAWGTVRDVVVTGFKPSWPRPPDRLAVRGRIVDGLFLSTTAGPTIRVAQALAARQLPGALGPALLSAFVADLIREAPVSFEGDAFGFALGAVDASDERFDSYLAALAAGGAIVPVTTSGGAQR